MFERPIAIVECFLLTRGVLGQISVDVGERCGVKDDTTMSLVQGLNTDWSYQKKTS